MPVGEHAVSTSSSASRLPTTTRSISSRIAAARAASSSSVDQIASRSARSARKSPARKRGRPDRRAGRAPTRLVAQELARPVGAAVEHDAVTAEEGRGGDRADDGPELGRELDGGSPSRRGPAARARRAAAGAPASPRRPPARAVERPRRRQRRACRDDEADEHERAEKVEVELDDQALRVSRRDRVRARARRSRRARRRRGGTRPSSRVELRAEVGERREGLPPHRLVDGMAAELRLLVEAGERGRRHPCSPARARARARGTRAGSPTPLAGGRRLRVRAPSPRRP